MRWFFGIESISAIRSSVAPIIRMTVLPAMIKLSAHAGLQPVSGRSAVQVEGLDDVLLTSPFVMGCAGLAARGRRQSTSDAFALLDAARSRGCTAFDTAAVYGNGQSELALGAWMSSRRTRQDVIVVGKGGHPDERGASRLGTDALNDDLRASLRRLRTEYIDLYMLHRDDPALPVGPTMETLHRFVQDGKVRAIGASNWSHLRIEAANQYAESMGLTPFTVSSPHMSLAEMYEPPWPGCISLTGEAGAPARAWYVDTQMTVLAWSPLSGGLLAGRGASVDHSRSYESAPNRERLRRLQLLAHERGATPAQLAISYLLHHEMRVLPVVAASTPDRLEQLLASGDFDLSAHDIAWLELGDDQGPLTSTP